MRQSNSDLKLTKYINEKTANGELIPFMTVIAKETGISNSTISRFAKRRGYYNFPALRAAKNDKNDNSSNISEKLYDMIDQDKTNFVVITSASSQSLGYHIVRRINDTKHTARFVDHKLFTRETAFSSIVEDEKVIFITVSGESYWLEEFLNKRIDRDYLVLASLNIAKVDENHISLYEGAKLKSTNNIDKYKIIREMFLWIDDTISKYIHDYNVSI